MVCTLATSGDTMVLCCLKVGGDDDDRIGKKGLKCRHTRQEEDKLI